MTFPLGRPILVMIAIAFVSGGILLTRRRPARADLTVWTFAEAHARVYRGDGWPTTRPSLVEKYRRLSGKSVRIDLMSIGAEDVRLISMFNSSAAGNGKQDAGDLPDLAEIEIGSVGKYFRAPLNEVGFLPLNDLLEQSGWKDRVLAARFTPWSKQGVIFGVPHDVHPVALAYRKDLFDEAGVDLATVDSWDDFQERCLQFQDYWAARGQIRRAVQMPSATAEVLVLMLLQRHISMLDDRDRIHIADPKVAETVALYASMVAGERSIGTDASPGPILWTRDLAEGTTCAAFCPDWRLGYIRSYQPELAGKMALMALPRFEEKDAPTSTWGGTMIGIPRGCAHPAEAWKLLQYLYLSDAGIDATLAVGKIVPPVPARWNNPIFHQPDAFFGGQKVMELYVQLAGEIPRCYVTPFTPAASVAITAVLNRAVAYQRNHGPDGLREACQQWLDEAAVELQKQIDFQRFDP